MKLSTRSRYAVRLLVALAAEKSDQPVLLKKIAEEEEISDKYLSQLIIPLKSAGLIRSFRGAKGGYALAKKPKEITVEEIVTVMEGTTEIIDCVENPDACSRVDLCITRDVWEGLGKVISDYLRSFTIADLASRMSKE